MRSQLAEGQLWACAWFTEIVFVCVCVCVCVCTYVRTYLPMFVHTHSCKQILLVVKAVSL